MQASKIGACCQMHPESCTAVTRMHHDLTIMARQHQDSLPRLLSVGVSIASKAILRGWEPRWRRCTRRWTARVSHHHIMAITSKIGALARSMLSTLSVRAVGWPGYCPRTWSHWFNLRLVMRGRRTALVALMVGWCGMDHICRRRWPAGRITIDSGHNLWWCCT